MALLHDLIDKIQDEDLKTRIKKEADRILNKKKFGLVFESHLPECTPLFDMPVKIGALVALKTGKIENVMYVRNIQGELAVCESRATGDFSQERLSDLIVVAQFGDPIYPSLQFIDSISTAPDAELWHTLIESDNYHALQLLQYLYAGQIDCIYIDPPYNTGAKDWKYNNDYVDKTDQYRHSKWLSFMERRLKLAKKLLKPQTGVLIITIDENEVHRLRLLVEEIFLNAYIQMITTVINPKGSTRGRFSRVEEYIIYVFMPEAFVIGGSDSMLGPEAAEDEDEPIEIKSETPRWKGLLRSGDGAKREDNPNLFYPILIDKSHNKIVRADPYIPINQKPDFSNSIEGYEKAFPIREDGTYGRWMLSYKTFNDMLEKGYISLGKKDTKRNTYAFSYLTQKYLKQIDDGILKIVGRTENGQTVIVEYPNGNSSKQIKTVWHRTRHDAGTYGSDLNKKMLGERSFSYPKSLYSVHDALSTIVRNNRNALILDFFAGSGTTLHAVNLLNAEDGGKRRCIIVTNNEISAAEAKAFIQKGIHSGDKEWEEHGIARYVTWPRTVCSIKGKDVKNTPLEGIYLGTEIPLANGFKSNVAYFKLGFLDKTAVELGLQLKEVLPIIWLKSGGRGKCPTLDSSQELPEYLILPENHFAILIDELSFHNFNLELNKYKEIDVLFIVTDSETNFYGMASLTGIKKTYQLYKDYLENFRINCEKY